MVGVVDILLLAMFALLRSYYIDNLPSTVQSPQAATDVYDTVLRYLNTTLQALLVVVIVILVAALYAGPSRPARWIRRRSFAAWTGPATRSAAPVPRPAPSGTLSPQSVGHWRWHSPSSAW
jgi:hypothetical protein